MKKKNIKLMILATIVTASFTTNVVYAAKPTTTKKNANKLETKQGKKQEKQNTKTLKEVDILSKRLDHIGTSYKKVNVKLEQYFNENNTSQSTAGSSVTTDVPTETTDSAATTDASTETTTDSTATTDVSAQTTTDSTVPTDISTQTTTDSIVTTDGSSEATTDTEIENEGDQSEEFENEYVNEDSQVNNSFYGKLNAIMNRLNTVKRQLNRLSSSDNEDVSNLNNRTDELINEVKASMEKVSNLQSENVTTLKNKLDKKIMEEQNINEQKKSWKIHFSKPIDPETINSKNIMIIDSQNNIVDTDVSYDQDSKDVIIEAKDGFIKAEHYSILISSDVKSEDGNKLQKTTEKRFSVE